MIIEDLLLVYCWYPDVKSRCPLEFRTSPVLPSAPSAPGGIVKAKFTPFVVLDTATPAVEPELADAVTLVVVRMSVAVGRLD